MQTAPHTVTVRDFQPEDAADILRIAAANGLGDFVWPPGSYPAVAAVAEHVVAFCALHEIPKGIVIDELWSQGDRDGLRGLHALAEWAEEQAAVRGAQLGRDLYLGGIVADSLPRHAAALESRGYAPYARVYGKLIPRRHT